MSKQERPLILVIDDHEDARYALERIVAHNGYSVMSAANGKEGLERARTSKPALIFCDLMMPGMDGFETAKELKRDPELRFIPVILVTARDSMEDVIKGLDSGADDYITKPFKAEELLARLRAALRLRNLYGELKNSTERNAALARELSRSGQSTTSIIGQSTAVTKLLSLIEKVSDAEAPVLITGESGTGKELVAQAIHQNSPRREQPFIARNCAAFSEHLLESELFGHVKGAFTNAIRDQKGIFEAADGGTLFLDEIGEMPLNLQPKLLRVLQEGTFNPVGSTEERRANVRIVAATNRDLLKMSQERTFREDLYYRLNVVNLHLPNLSERRGDIPLLLEHFLSRGADARGEAVKKLSSEALECLLNYNWPGNIRELQNEVERLLILGKGQREIGLDLISDRIVASSRSADERQSEGEVNSSYRDAVESLEKRLILEALERSNWNKSDAARTLGISRSNLLAKIQTYGLAPK